jgi:hypothetical protein
MDQSREPHRSARPHHSPEGASLTGADPAGVMRLKAPCALVVSGSRRAATGAGGDPQTCRQTVMDRDHRNRPVRAAHLTFLTEVPGPQHPGIPVR